MSIKFMTAATLAAALALPHVAQAKTPLVEIPQIRDGIFALVVANEIRKSCDDIDGRVFKGIGQIRALKSKANDLGYSDDEIRALLDSDKAKAKMRARGRTYMAQKGLNYDKPGDLCKLGHAEIANNSAIGALLKAN